MRGVSPVIATILMVVIAIAAAVVAWSWFSSLTSSTQSQANKQMSSLATVNFQILSAECNSDDTNTLDIYINNLMDSNLNATASIIIKDASGNVKLTQNNVTLTAPAGGVKSNPVCLGTVSNGKCLGKTCSTYSGDTVEIHIGAFVQQAEIK